MLASHKPPRSDIRLVPVAPEHAPSMNRWMRDPLVADSIGLRKEPSLERTQSWIADAVRDDSCQPFAILLGDRHVGNVVLDRLDRQIGTARLSIYIGEADARGAGAGERAVRLALAEAFVKLHLSTVWLTVHVRNGPAIALYHRCGFSIEAVLPDGFLIGGQRVDALRMIIRQGEAELR